MKFGPATVSTSVAAPAATVACDRNIFVSERKAEKGNQNCENAWKGQSQRAAAHSTCARRTRAPTVLAEDSRAPIASPTAIAKRSTPPNSGTSRPRSCSGIAMRSVAFWRRCKSKNPVSLQLEQEFYAFMCKCPRHDLKYVRQSSNEQWVFYGHGAPGVITLKTRVDRWIDRSVSRGELKDQRSAISSAA